jgi:hypothetical protein
MVDSKSALLDQLESVNNDLASEVNASTTVQANSVASLQQNITDAQKKLSSFDDLEASKQKAQKSPGYRKSEGCRKAKETNCRFKLKRALLTSLRQPSIWISSP